MVFYRAAGTPPASHSWTGSPACHVAPSIAVLVLAVVSVLSIAGTAHAAPGDLPVLSGNSAATAAPDWYDDHSLGGDNHLSWSPAGGEVYTNDFGQQSQREPHDIEWQSSVTVGGPGGLEVCGYPSGTVGWMRAYQAAPGAMAGGSCPVAEPAAGQFGWFRYVYGRHAEQLNRWHLMDLERSALVPLTPGVPTVWDNHWGTCLNLLANATLNCEGNRGAAGLDVGVAGAARRSPRSVTSTRRRSRSPRRRTHRPRTCPTASTRSSPW